MSGFGSIKNVLSSLISSKRANLAHPWFKEFNAAGIELPDKLSGFPSEHLSNSLDLSSPILFIARGHSGTTPLAKLLEVAGVYIGNHEDEYSLNRTYDSLYWAFGFQRTLLPRLFKPGEGCFIDQHIVSIIALECLRRHLSRYSGGPWGFKTCEGMFSHSLYQYVFPRAKYIYMVRDGRDVVLSGKGLFHLTNPLSRQQHWENFKLLTFGISNDIHSCPFKFPSKPHENDNVMRHKYWIQAKSWREHVCMVEHLRRTGQLSPNIYTIKYEELCSNSLQVIENLFAFLDIELTIEAKDFAQQLFHTKSIGRWKDYTKHVYNCSEDMEKVFASMEPELELLGYTI